MDDFDMNEIQNDTQEGNAGTERDENEQRRVARFCFAKPRRSVNHVEMNDIKALTNDKESIKRAVNYFPSRIPDVIDLIDLARRIQGFQTLEGRLLAPSVILRESLGFNLEYASELVDISFGNERTGPKMITSKHRKSRILGIMQKREIHKIDKGEYKALLVGLKDIETLVVIPLQNTDKRIDERSEASEATENIHERSDRNARFQAYRTLIALQPYIHTFSIDGEPEVIHAFMSNIVIGNEGRLTKNQVAVSKLMWKGLFNTHPTLMSEEILSQVFQVRSRKRPREDTPDDAPPEQPHSSTAGKAILPPRPQRTAASTDEEGDTYTTMMQTIEARSVDISRPVVDFLKTFVSGYVEVIDPFTFMYDLDPIMSHPTPEDVLLESLPTFLAHEECADLKLQLQELLPTIQDEVHVVLE